MVDGVQVYRFRAPQPASGFLGYIWEYGYSLGALFITSLALRLREDFDVVHAHQPPDAFAFIAAFYKLLGKRYVMDHHDLAPELYHARFRGRGPKGGFQVLAWLERLSCRLADSVLATNESYKRVEMERDGVSDRRITIVRNGPDLEELRLTEPDPAVRGGASVVIGYVGVTGIQDGVEHLLRAVRHLAGDLQRTGFRCVVVGSGAALPGLRALAAKSGIAELVLFTGWVDSQAEVARLLSGMDVCVAPEPPNAYNERSTAAKVMEYMAMGKPVVAFDLPEHRFTAGEAALYARPGDDFDLAVRIAALMDDAGLRRELGRRGRARVEEELSWQKQAKALLEAYAEMFPSQGAS
jgi:glycosyltransferase involved in cell wall biosynthesis